MEIKKVVSFESILCLFLSVISFSLHCNALVAWMGNIHCWSSLQSLGVLAYMARLSGPPYLEPQ